MLPKSKWKCCNLFYFLPFRVTLHEKNGPTSLTSSPVNSAPGLANDHDQRKKNYLQALIGLTGATMVYGTMVYLLPTMKKG